TLKTGCSTPSTFAFQPLSQESFRTSMEGWDVLTSMSTSFTRSLTMVDVAARPGEEESYLGKPLLAAASSPITIAASRALNFGSTSLLSAACESGATITLGTRNARG